MTDDEIDRRINEGNDDPVAVVVSLFLSGASIERISHAYDFHINLTEGIIRLALRTARCTAVL